MEEERKLLTESHNIKHYSETLQDTQFQSNFDNSTIKFLNAFFEIAMLFSEPLVLYSKHIIRQIFFWIVSENTTDKIYGEKGDMCTFLPYNVMLEKAHEALCDRKHDVEGSFDESCELLQCNVTNMTASVCQRLHSNVCAQVMSLNKSCSSVLLNTYSKLCKYEQCTNCFNNG